MNFFTAAFLGIIQGLTEFLPVSSSGHLVLFEHLLNFEQPGILFDVTLHAGTLLAVLIYFRKKLMSLTPRMLILLFVGTIPAAVIGLLFEEQLEASFGDIKMVGLQLIITGIICYFVDKVATKKDNISVTDSFVIGVAQAIAIIPGISRSGSTIFAGVMRGIDKAHVAEFSFLLSIPAILGAIVLQIIKYKGQEIDIAPYSIGFLTAFVFGLLAIRILLNLLKTKNFKIFTYYCLVLGVLVILL